MLLRDPQAVLETLGKSYTTEILAATDEPQSAAELSDSLDIPIATCYRRVDELAAHGLLEARTATDNGAVTEYERVVDTVCADFADGPTLSTHGESRVQATLDTIWQRVA